MSKIEHRVTPEPGRYDFDGACAPHNHPRGTYGNFSLGIFQWDLKWAFADRPLEAIKPHMLKRSKIFKRVLGCTTHQPEAAYDEARRLCAGYNNGTLTPPLKHAND